jgi:hypothetical protein
MALQPDDIDDLTNLTLKKYARKKWVDISYTRQRNFFVERFMGKKTTPSEGGIEQTWKVQVNATGNARFTGLYGVDSTSVRNLTIEASQKWAASTNNFIYDVNEPLFQSELETIVEQLLVREHDMMMGWYDLMETALWTSPISSTQDPRPVSGIPFWLQKNATEGFNGGDPSGFAAGAANILTSSYANWKNYTFSFSKISRDDLIAKWIKAVEWCQFRPAHSFQQLDASNSQWVFYTTWNVLEPLFQFNDSRNDNLKDLSGIPTAVFRGVPVDWVPALSQTSDAAYDSQNPLYGIDWSCFEFFFLKGKELNRYPAQQVPNQHTVRIVHADSIGNMKCKNRRRSFVGYLA